MISRNFNLLIIIAFPILLLGCMKENYDDDGCIQNEISRLRLSNSDRVFNPYTGKELLTYKSTLGDSVVFPKGDRYLAPYFIYEFPYQDKCKGDYIRSEEDWTEFRIIAGGQYLRLELFKAAPFSAPTNYKQFFFLTFSMGGYDPKIAFGGAYEFMNDSIFTSNPYDGDSVVAFHPSISLGPKIFSNVYELTSVVPDTGWQKWNTTIYYSVLDGLVGMHLKHDSIVWYLAKKQ